MKNPQSSEQADNSSIQIIGDTVVDIEGVYRDLAPKIDYLSDLYCRGNYHLKQDLRQEGSLGLMLAADRYRPNGGAQFKTFADRYIRGKMQNFLRSEEKHLKCESFYEEGWGVNVETGAQEREDDEANSILSDGGVESFLWQVEVQLIRQPLRMAQTGFTAHQRRILKLRYAEDLTLSEISRVLAVSPARISQVLSEAVQKLRQAFIRI